MVQGNGSGILKPVCRLVRGVWRPISSELLMPSLTTKVQFYFLVSGNCCLLSAVCCLLSLLLKCRQPPYSDLTNCFQYCLVATLMFFLLPGELTYVAIAGLFLAMKVNLQINIIKSNFDKKLQEAEARDKVSLMLSFFQLVHLYNKI